MACLIKSKNKPLLDEYTSMLGSENAAYYVLCMNNGYSLEFTPTGEKSDLFQKLLIKNNYDYEAAIEEKAQMYYPSYYNNIGGDWTMDSFEGLDDKGEPKIEFVPSPIDFSDIIDLPISINESDILNLSEIEKNALDYDLNNYLIQSIVSNSNERISKSEEWLKQKQDKLVRSINKDLIEAFGLEKHTDKQGNIYFTSKEKDSDGKYKLIVSFCEYIENGKKGVYDQTGRLEAAANLIQISLLDGDPSTINHELAHHYVRMFWNSEVVQNAVQKLDNGDRSEGWQVRLEEKLVDEITKRTTKADTFWVQFKDILKSMFLWLSSPIKQNLLRKASLAFRLNDKSVAIRTQGYILSFIDKTANRVYQNGSPNLLIDEFDSIVARDLNRAITRYVENSIDFFVKYTAQPDSILKDEYDEYVQHVQNYLCSTTLNDNDFNTIYLFIRDEYDRLVNNHPDTDSGENKAAVAILFMANESRNIRANLNASTGSGLAPTGSNRTTGASLKELMSDIMRGLRTRIYEYKHSVPKAAQEANKVQELLNKMQALYEDLDKLTMFIDDGLEELAHIKRNVDKMAQNGFDNVSTQQLQALWNAIEGFYDPIIDMIAENDEVKIMNGGILYPLSSKLSNMKQLCWDIKSTLANGNTKIIRDTTHNYLFGDGNTDQGVAGDLLTEEQKNRFLENFDDQLIFGKLFEDINGLQPYIGLSSRSRSTIIRVARNMILSANSEIRKATLKDAANIVKLYFMALPEMKRLGLSEIQSVFQEMDENGNKTGYFVRKLNYGKFYRDMNTNRDKLVEEANQKLQAALGQNAPQITYDYYNNPVLPPDDDLTVKRILTEYADGIDDWLCKHSNRMFIPSYYEMRRQMLSPNTRKVMQELQSRINAIMSKAPVLKVTLSNGQTCDIQATWELSPEDQQNLVQLRTEYQQLGSLYYTDGTKKGGEEAQIAQEISDFNEWKGKLIKYKQNHDRFEACIQKIRDKYGRNSTEEARFRKLNTSIVVNPDYYEYVLSKIHLANDPTLNALRKKRGDLRKLIEEFDKKGIDIEQKRRQLQYWDSLKEVDKEITELLEGMNSGPVPEDERWSHYFDKEKVMYDENESLIDHMLNQDLLEYKRTHPADTRSDDKIKEDLIKKYCYTYSYKDEHGNVYQTTALTSVFMRYVPKGASINNNVLDGTFARDALIVKYSSQFSDVDETSPMYNKDFDRNDSHLIQPKHDEYDNSEQWNKIQNNENIKNLYNAIIELMNRNSAKLPTNSDFNYRLPQITARRLAILRRSGSLKEICDSCKYIWKQDWQLNERDDQDVNYEDKELKIRANGTRINTVPTRFLKPLEHPEFITSDVIGSIIAFTEMANNFVVKTQLSSELELLKHQLQDREDANMAQLHNRQATTNIIKQLNNMMDAHLYGNTTKWGNKDSEFNKKEQRIIKFMTTFQHLGRILMLGYNFTSMSVGFFESFIRGNLEAFLGKDYTLRDLMHGHYSMLKNTIPLLLQCGGIEVKTKQIALMQWFGISKNVKASYHGTERNRYIKLLSENINGMFGFTLGDYGNSAFQLSMALSNVRFINNGKIPTGFYTKQTLIRAIQKAENLSYKEAKKKAVIWYKESSICLEDAYDLEDGIIKVKSEYQSYVNNVLENRVTGKCYQRLAEALGVTPESDTPGYALWVLLRPIGVLRSYLFTTIARNWNWAHDLQHRYLDPNNNIVKEDDMLDGYLDLDAGNMNIGIHQGLIGWLRMMGQQLNIIEKKANAPDMTDETKEIYNYAASKIGLEVLSIALLVGLSTLFKAAAKGSDDDDWWYRFGYLTSVRLVNSFISILDPTSILEVVKNISTLISPLNDLIRCITILSDTLGLSGHSPFDEIQSGSYKGQTRLFRNLMRITPFGNAYEDLSSSALKSRANWYLQQDPIIWSALGGAFDQLWGTGK